MQLGVTQIFVLIDKNNFIEKRLLHEQKKHEAELNKHANLLLPQTHVLLHWLI